MFASCYCVLAVLFCGLDISLPTQDCAWLHPITSHEIWTK